MSEAVSLLEVIKRGGYEASLITTFNATLPFYEEVLLRKLVGAGCRHNVVLMDRQQCAVAWGSQATRPRLAGHAYTLLPIGVNGAFHPKICLLLGAKKASILIGSHNLTLSGLGFNREITNWVEVGGVKDGEGAAILRSVWQMLREWINLEHGKVPAPLLESALAIDRFIAPLIARAGPMTTPAVLGQWAGAPSLIDQVAAHITAPVRRIAVLGAFFDRELLLIRELKARWPETQVVIGIDPETVQHPGIDVKAARHVDARSLWSKEAGYLHAKVFYFESDQAASDVFVSGSANPSRPAWMGRSGSGNVEAVLLQVGNAARKAAEATSMRDLFELPDLDHETLVDIRQRNAVGEIKYPEGGLPILVGFSIVQQGLVRITCRGNPLVVTRAVLLGPNQEELERVDVIDCSDDEVAFRTTVEPTDIRSCLLEEDGYPVARAMILHPSIIESNAQSSRHYQIRSALSELGSSDADISKLIASVERVIFAEQTDHEIEEAIREHHGRLDRPVAGAAPESLVINVNEMTRSKHKQRLLKSGDLAYLIDVLMRRLSEGLEVQGIEVDRAGRTEEEQVGQEDETPDDYVDNPAEKTRLSDAEIVQIVARKARSLCRKMVQQLELASHEESRQVVAPIQLIAVLALIRELRHLDKQKRWLATGQPLVEECDRRYLLDESVRYLLGSQSRLLDVIDKAAGDSADETMQLRTLLVWLAWDLGDELTGEVSRIWDADEKRCKLQANALFLALLPAIAADRQASTELRDSIQRTVKSTPVASMQAEKWLGLHMVYGSSWTVGEVESEQMEVGGYCRVPGLFDEPRIILELSQDVVGFWDFDKVRKFERGRVIALVPAL